MSQKTIDTHDQNSAAQMTPTTAAVAMPETLDSTGSKLVYMYLDVTDGCDITALRESLDMQTIAIYPILQTLAAKGLVEREGDLYRVVT